MATVEKSGRRRTHFKSRLGCRACKLRRVKCSEEKPSCSNCLRAHIACSYGAGNVQMQSSHEFETTNSLLSSSRYSNNEAVLGMINGVLSRHNSPSSTIGHTFRLRQEDLDILFRYQSRTVSAFGPPWLVNAYRAESVRLAALNPYLLHILITCTAMHDRYLAGKGHEMRTPFESYHWAMASQLLNYEISKDIQTCDRDALWMASTTMSWVSLFAVETQNPEELWPLSPPNGSEIPWSPIHKGLKTLWALLMSGRLNESVFFIYRVRQEDRCLDLPSPAPGLEGVPQVLIDLCDLNDSSNAENNPYFTAVRILSDLLEEGCRPLAALKFFTFVNTMDPEFEALISQRDPRSLALLAVWYGLVPKSAWWISLRASLSRKAICVYLERNHADYSLIHEVLGLNQRTPRILGTLEPLE